MTHHSLTSSSSFKLPALAALAALALPLASADAGTITYSPTVPTFDENDVAQLSTGTLATNSLSYGNDGNTQDDNANYIASDRPAQGQTFTINEAGFIDAITVKGTGGQSEFRAGIQLTLRINAVEANTLTTIYTDVAALPIAGGNFSDYLTFTLATPVAVSAGLTYGFDFGNTEGNEGFYFQIDGAPQGSFTAGTAYSSGTRSGFGTPTADFRNTDRTFGISFTPVPEPTSFAIAMLGSVAMMGIRRRRLSAGH